MFKELLDNPTGRHPGELQEEARRKFPDLIKSSKLHLFDNAKFGTENDYLIICVATYSPMDLELLDELNQSSLPDKFRIQVANIEEFHPIKEFQFNYATTPFVILSKDGMVEFRQGLQQVKNLLEI